jgi:hypothetical protein
MRFARFRSTARGKTRFGTMRPSLQKPIALALSTTLRPGRLTGRAPSRATISLWPSRCWRPRRLRSLGFKRPTGPGPWRAAPGVPLGLRAFASERETRACASCGRLRVGKYVSLRKSLRRKLNNLLLDDSLVGIVKNRWLLGTLVVRNPAPAGHAVNPAIPSRRAVDNPTGSE